MRIEVERLIIMQQNLDVQINELVKQRFWISEAIACIKSMDKRNRPKRISLEPKCCSSI